MQELNLPTFTELHWVARLNTGSETHGLEEHHHLLGFKSSRANVGMGLLAESFIDTEVDVS